MATPCRIAIVHDWLTSNRGGEKVLEALCEEYPSATIYTLLHVPGSVSPLIEGMSIHTSFVQHLPAADRIYRHYLPVFPAAVRTFDLSPYDIVISSHHCVAKGVRTLPRTLHICYCHSPMRYLWGFYDDYFGPGRASLPTRAGMRLIRDPLRRWDRATAKNPHWFVANSEYIRARILDVYGRESDIIYPPVNARLFEPSQRDEGWFLVVSALVPYKRVDLAVRAFSRTGERLVVVGSGPEAKRLRGIAGPTVEFAGWVGDDELRDLYARCTALVFPGEEDFGIVPVEAMASGKPVIAYAKGGALETVIDGADGSTGVLFHEQTEESLREAVQRFRRLRFSPEALHEYSLRFDRGVFRRQMREYVQRRWSEFEGKSRQTHI